MATCWWHKARKFRQQQQETKKKHKKFRILDSGAKSDAIINSNNNFMASYCVVERANNRQLSMDEGWKKEYKGYKSKTLYLLLLFLLPFPLHDLAGKVVSDNWRLPRAY